jgi:transposase
VTDVVDHWPQRCSCGHVFADDEREPVAAPARHQVAELPPVAVEISEHRLQRLCCPACGGTVRAELPAGVPRGCFGPKLEAAIASLTVRNRLSRRQLVELMEELFGCPLAVGTIDAILTRTAETLEPVYDELLERTRDATALNIDETGWYLSGEPRTLLGALSKRTAVLRIAPDRGKQHLHGLIGDDSAGVVGSRRSGSRLFQQDGDRAALQQRVAMIKKQMGPLLEWGSTGKRQRHVRALAKNLLKLWPALWTFADVADVEPTNNAAERGLRAAVIYRKLSLGSRSQGGERTIERLLSVDQTCRLQRRSLYAYLADVLTAKARGDPVPALT